MRHCSFMVSSISNEQQCSCFTLTRARLQLLHAVQCRASTETTGLLFENELVQTAPSAAFGLFTDHEGRPLKSQLISAVTM